jgi:hypothetical protein
MEKTEHDESERMVVFVLFFLFVIWFLMGKNLSTCVYQLRGRSIGERGGNLAVILIRTLRIR